MPKRRASGEGNIHKRKDGRWEGRYTVGHDPETGKAIIKNVLGKTQAGDTVKTELIYDREKVRAESCPDFSYISAGVDYTDKSAFNWISVIRLPDFITKEDFEWAVDTAAKKKKLDCSSAEFLTIDEGLCVQIMHLGAFDDEPATVALMDAYLERNGYVNDMNMERLHHEIYLSDARKVAPEKWKTVIRHPIKKI